MTQFYKGLKDDVKDDLYKEDISDTFIKYIQHAIKIDNHLYIRRIERHDQGPFVNQHRIFTTDIKHRI